ncbi:Putative inner membrane protein; similar to 60 kDa inner membrane protein family [Prochlorococcus marinus str. MIT 9313]|uniref:Membrane protein insertase YidC n=1 Tax=Prochlorococcus marinus (strain MIT 9313) TaxID=74547 RepID=YIDC_PROMM|nr:MULTISPECIES: membrane protein insertase YidC [Prochlorococcus]Q7V610.1 RecName: Full=Membrane protein insertase YidC; AltName: Full=Foldase YidC; AltName: Full=Membrane integrase YidC; AltName: Full=Membrane protein YidC [Prochlorococcus marinus str. MIT 9313]MED5263784.1 membrane protein insertase YidC [Cyanobacteriota bacterium]NMO85154.1 membrane protein insertase YidC [Prochlorococcus sp. P1344]NMP07113.1 membrane protein insertase YidC [Prochlorococcus sp. P1361]NMP14342.1 membrane pr
MIGYISDNILLPILDFFYGLVPSYGLAIVALTVVIRLALFPLSAGSIRSARRMRIAQPAMKKRQDEIKSRYAKDPQKQQEELGKVMKEFGNPLSGCLPLLVQMPILFALFATLRGSPFADVPYLVNLKVLPSDQIAAIEPKPFTSSKHSIFISETKHFPVIASLPSGTKLGVGDKAQIKLQTLTGESFTSRLSGVEGGTKFTPTWSVTKGDDLVKVSADGTVQALAEGDATVQGKIPGLAAQSGFLFIKALGQVGFYVDGEINWDIAILVGGFGLTLLVSQILSGRGLPANPQQSTANKITPVMITGMFLFFPLPAGVLLYMVIANIFQAGQTFLLSREALPENLQKILNDQLSKPALATEAIGGSDRLPFEPKKRSK